MNLSETDVRKVLDTRFIKAYELSYENGVRYIDASRHDQADLAALKSDQEIRRMLPDAVSCVLINETPEGELRLYLTEEFRYPMGQYLLSIPSGLIDPEDRKRGDPLKEAVTREIREETGIRLMEDDLIEVINPLLFSSPGMTDECSAVVRVIVRRDVQKELTQKGAEESELFRGCRWMTKEEVRKILKKGTDDTGMFFSCMTWIVMMAFVSDVFE